MMTKLAQEPSYEVSDLFVEKIISHFIVVKSSLKFINFHLIKKSAKINRR